MVSQHTIAADIETVRLATAAGLFRAAMLYYLARSLPGGLERVNVAELRASARAAGYSRSAFYAALDKPAIAAGRSAFWHRASGDRLYFRSQQKAATRLAEALQGDPALDFRPPGVAPLLMPASATPADAYAVWTGERSGQMIARVTLGNAWGVTGRTLRRWDKLGGVTAEARFAAEDISVNDALPPSVELRRDRRAGFWMSERRRRREARWQLPNVYHAPRSARSASRGQGRRIRASFRDVVPAVSVDKLPTDSPLRTRYAPEGDSRKLERILRRPHVVTVYAPLQGRMMQIAAHTPFQRPATPATGRVLDLSALLTAKEKELETTAANQALAAIQQRDRHFAAQYPAPKRDYSWKATAADAPAAFGEVAAFMVAKWRSVPSPP